MKTILFSSLVFLFHPGIVLGENLDEKISIGVSTPLTGDSATFGEDVRDILLFANEKLTDNKYNLIIEDDGCSAKQGAIVASKFVNIHKVKYVIGLPCSAPALAAAPLYERGKVTTLVTWASSPKIAQAGDFIFRTTPSDRLAAETLAKHIRAKHRQITVLSGQTDYAQDFKDAFLEVNKDKPLVITEVDYIPHQTDFKSILLKIKFSKPEALFLNTEDEAAFAVAIKNIREVNWDLPIYGAYWPSSSSLQKVAKENLDGIEFVDTPDLTGLLTPDGLKVYEDYKKKYGNLRSSESSFAPTFEALRALDLAISSGKDVREFLYHSKFSGIFGPYSFDKNGESQGILFVMKRINKGQIALLED